METETSSIDLITSLQNLVKTYLQKHSHLSLSALAQRSNVPLTTLRRLVNGEQKSELAPHSVLNLTSYIYKQKSLSNLLLIVPAEIKDYLGKYFGAFIFESKQRVYSHDLNELLKDPIYYLIYKLAANHHGTTWIEITEICGSLGKRKAEELLLSGVLVEEESRLHASEKDFSLDIEIATSHLPLLVNFFEAKNVSHGKNLFYSLSEALNLEAISEIKKVQRDAVNKIYQIMKDPQSFGEHPYFSLNICETFIPSNQGELQ